MTTTDIHDAVLANDIAAGREQALAEVYRRHAGSVRALALRLIHDADLAEDVVQEVFLRLWRHPRRFDPERGSLRSYLLAHTHGRSVDLIRSESARRRREEREARLAPVDLPGVAEQVWQSALADEVRQALAGLAANERKAIELAYYGGLTYREVARLLAEPEGTVKSRIRSGLRRLSLALAGVHGA